MDNIFENRAAFGRNKPAWHHKGYVAQGLMTRPEIIEKAGLDYVVEKVKAYFMNEEITADGIGEYAQPAPGHYLTIARWQDRKPTVLGAVGDQYEVLQNKDAFLFFDPLIEDGEAVFDAAGVLGRGERVWVLAMIPDLVMTVGAKEDRTVTYLLVTNSHDGSSSVTCAVVNIRVVCQNTLLAGLSGAPSKIKIRHTKSMKDRLQEASRVMGVARRNHEKVSEVFNAMAAHKMTKEDRVNYTLNVFGIDMTKLKESKRYQNIMAEVGALFEADPLADKDSLWAMYNALTAYTDHRRTVRSSDKSNGTAHLNSIWFGSGARLKEKAFSKAVALLS